MHFTNEIEACLAVASIVLSADKVGTEQERTYLFERAAESVPLNAMSAGELRSTMDRINAQLFDSEDALDRWLHPEGMKRLSNAVRMSVPEHRLPLVLRFACEMACSDGLLLIERELLESLGKGLGMTKEVVDHYISFALVRAEDFSSLN